MVAQATGSSLLEHLARDPDEREPPLSWGLQYYVRGNTNIDELESSLARTQASP